VHHCNADNFKTLKATYMMITLNMSIKFHFEIPSDCWKTAKKSGLAAACIKMRIFYNYNVMIIRIPCISISAVYNSAYNSLRVGFYVRDKLLQRSIPPTWQCYMCACTELIRMT